MRLAVRQWGDGPRAAVLIHGLMQDHRAWSGVASELVARGYRVIAVDLRGHGLSGRGEYTPELFADDLADTLPVASALAIGHSLGGLALSLAVDRLRPEKAVYSDPAWRLGGGDLSINPALFAEFKRIGKTIVRRSHPNGTEVELAADMDALRLWDESTARSLSAFRFQDYTPSRPVVPSLVLIPEQSKLVTAEMCVELRGRGFTVNTLEGAGHGMYRDNARGFLRSLDDWL